MSLRIQFNLILLVVFALGFFGFAAYLKPALEDRARSEVLQRASLMMESAKAFRSYTIEEIRPLLTLQMKRVFLPQSIPAYAATQSFNNLREHHPDFYYKEAALNPTNLRDRAVDWETDVINIFRNDKSLKEFMGEREAANGRSLYLARPISIDSEACLLCHSTPSAAPKTVIDIYGTQNGFGWKLNETIGAQIVSVPLGIALDEANRLFQEIMLLLTVGILVAILLLNLLLQISVIRPVTSLTDAAEKISTGDMEGEVPEKGAKELSKLARSFNRMRRSLDKAFTMLNDGD